jgi:hypothetical protein
MNGADYGSSICPSGYSDKEHVAIRIDPKGLLVPRQFIPIVARLPSGTLLVLCRISPPLSLKRINPCTSVICQDLKTMHIYLPSIKI